MTEVGIDAVEIWTGKLKLDLPGTFAPEKGDDPEKYTKGSDSTTPRSRTCTRTSSRWARTRRRG